MRNKVDGGRQVRRCSRRPACKSRKCPIEKVQSNWKETLRWSEIMTGRLPLFYPIVGIVPVIWLALLIAPSISGGLPEIAANLATLFDNPFFHKNYVRTAWKLSSFCFCAMEWVSGFISRQERITEDERNYGLPNGAMSEPLIRNTDKKPLSENKLMTQNVCIGLNAKKHRRNLNTLVCGGSGAGKTRFYCKPNLMQCNTSFVILDPKGEILRDTGKLLEKKGYEVRVLDLSLWKRATATIRLYIFRMITMCRNL